MLGRRHSELLGKNIWSEFPEAVGGPFHLAYQDALNTGHEGRLVRVLAPWSAGSRSGRSRRRTS